LFYELGFSQSNPTTIHYDNPNVIALNENPKYHSRNKHVEIQNHFTQKKVLDKQIQLKYVFTSDMTIDIFIKSLLRNKHFQCIENSKKKEEPTFQYQALMTFHGKRYSTSLCGRFSGNCIHCTFVSQSQPTKPTLYNNKHYLSLFFV